MQIIIFLILSSIVEGAQSKYKFALIGKTVNDSFFVQAGKGCKQAASELDNVECQFVGGNEVNPRIQVSIISKLINKGIDGIAIAVIDPEFLLKSGVLQKAKEKNIPIVTFDSGFPKNILEKNADLSLSYIGTNNFMLGQELGKMLLKIKPKGGTFCIQSGWEKSPNLKKRIEGVESITNTSSKWKQSKRCPLYSRENTGTALFQLNIMLNKTDAFIAVGGWAQYNDIYKQTILTFKKDILNNKKALIMADTQPEQIKLLKQKLSFFNIGQNPFKMGEESIKVLYKIKTKKEYKKIIYTPVTICTYKNYKTCLN